ncbi:MAG TPA: TetR/AcrR family transcriptional regulator [Solirubrobacteraceae bacterium]|nr:TetR/AcrR family transcriptional regulator [Solirubrobacteraceae bacterium]
MAPQLRKSTQRARLLAGMVQATVERGYEGANVSAVIARARVSRPTFYDYFAAREACFLAALEDLQEQMLEHASRVLVQAEPRGALAAVVGALVDFAAQDPGAGRFLTAEAMTGGPAALALRDDGIERLATLVTAAEQHAAASSPLPDVDARVVLGSVHRMLAMRLRRGETRLQALGEALRAWVASYERPARSRRWASLAYGPRPAPSAHVPATPIQRMPGVFGPGRPRVSEEEVVENHRLRILYAVARLAAERAYGGVLVGDIRRLARVDGQVFYRLFADKQEAFAAAHELGFQQVMDVTSKAFFSAAAWPERSWEAGRALTELLDANPLIGTVGFVEAYAAGPETVQRVEDSHAAFMFFLQDGLVHSKREPPPSREAMEAIIAGVFEIVYLEARKSKPQSARMLGYIAHLWLAPFLGAAASDRFIQTRLERESRRGRSAGKKAPRSRVKRGRAP